MPCILRLAKFFLQTLHLRLARMCLASCALQDYTLQALHLATCKAVPWTLRLARLHLAGLHLAPCKATPCKPCTLQALKALFWGGSYFTLDFRGSSCWDIWYCPNPQYKQLIYTKFTRWFSCTYGDNTCSELPNNLVPHIYLWAGSVASETILIHVNKVEKYFPPSAEKNAWGAKEE